MKQQITTADVSILDPLVVAAESIVAGIDAARDTQRGIVLAIEQLLAIDEWDHEKRAAVEQYIAEGGREMIEEFLTRLGVVIDDRVASE